MIYLITGGAGFIGSHTADVLIKNDHTVVILDNLSTGNLNNLSTECTFINEDITKDLSYIFEKYNFDGVIHLAAHVNVRQSMQNPAFDAHQNIVGTINVLQHCLKYGVKNFVFSSSGGTVYGDSKIIPTPVSYSLNPQSPYGISKMVCETYIKQLHGEINTTILRYGNVYGPRQDVKGEAGIVSIFMSKMIKNEKPIIFGDGNQTRDFIFAKDVANINMQAIQGDNNFSIYNVGSGIETRIIDLFDMINELCFDGKFKPIFKNEVSGELKRSCLDVSETKREFNIEETGDLFNFTETYLWCKEKYGIKNKLKKTDKKQED